MVQVAVVGAGITGLVAASRLIDQGASVTLYEPGVFGGVIQTRNVEGFTLECGPNIIVEKPEIAALIDAVGLRGSVVYPQTERYKQFVWYAGAPYEVPKRIVPFLTSSLLTLPEKLKIVRALLIRGQFLHQDEEQCVAEFFSRGLGESITFKVIDPVLKGIYGGSLHHLSAASLFPGLWAHTQTGASLLGFLKQRRRESVAVPQIFLLKGGMERLVEALCDRIRPQVKHHAEKVTQITRIDQQFLVRSERGEELRFDRVICATSGAATASFLNQLSPELSSVLSRLNYAPLTVVHLAIRTGHSLPRDAFGILFPRGTPHHLLGVMFNSLLFPHLAPDGYDLLTVCLGGVERADGLDPLTSEDGILGRLVIDELRRYLGVSADRVLSICRWPRAVPQYEVGHRRLVELMRGEERNHPGLLFVGVDQGGVGVSHRVRTVVEQIG